MTRKWLLCRQTLPTGGCNRARFSSIQACRLIGMDRAMMMRPPSGVGRCVSILYSTDGEAGAGSIGDGPSHSPSLTLPALVSVAAASSDPWRLLLRRLRRRDAGRLQVDAGGHGDRVLADGGLVRTVLDAARIAVEALAQVAVRR